MVTRIWGALIGAFRSSLLFLLLNIVFFLGSLAYDWLLRIFFFIVFIPLGKRKIERLTYRSCQSEVNFA